MSAGRTGTTGSRPLASPRLTDEPTERALRDVRQAVDDLRSIPAAAARIISGVALADGIATPVAHKLGRVPSIVLVSRPRGGIAAGRIDEIDTDPSYDATKYVVLKATGYGATVTVTIEVK